MLLSIIWVLCRRRGHWCGNPSLLIQAKGELYVVIHVGVSPGMCSVFTVSNPSEGAIMSKTWHRSATPRLKTLMLPP